eukprot:TRINITY_DN811_c0_g3_i1.p1 TRINITY_DN811_c0_g3~~TRINITY_DN811_c0_g3_i1.p1  ORF type:complete len:1118 (-),score=403.09 TRINITY_DN811_c0_g3_i1:68-3421(-)
MRRRVPSQHRPFLRNNTGCEITITMSSSDLSNWVNDQLHTLLGFAERSTVDYLLAQARKTKTPDEFLKQLEDFDVPINAASRTFATELYERLPTRQASSASLAEAKRKEQEVQTRSLLKKNAKYSLMLDDDGDGDGGMSMTVSSSKKKKKKSKKTKKEKKEKGSSSSSRKRGAGGDAADDEDGKKERHTRERKASNWDEDDGDGDVGLLQREGQRKRMRFEDFEMGSDGEYSDDDDDEDEDGVKKESRAERDRREVAEYNARLKEKDESKTKKFGGEGGSKAAQEEANKRAKMAKEMQLKEDNELLRKLRTKSRQVYLTKREEQMLTDLKEEIKDEEFLFAGAKLTSAEQRELETKKRVLALAEKRALLSDKIDAYQMPESEMNDEGHLDLSKREALLQARYVADEQVVSEQQQWEDHQLGMSQLQFGSKGKAPGVKQYDFVLDDAIDFVKDDLIAGERVGDEEVDEGPVKTVKETLAEVRASLPIFPYREELLAAIDRFQVLIVVGETGSGKTTQIPQYLHEAGYTKRGAVGCTQPRRVAAMSVAKRVADEMGTKLGHEVGYSIRFEDCTSDRTVVKYMTDGMLLREFLSEPDLGNYSVLMIDEAHERTLHTDILFGLVKDIARFRPDLKLVISSATLDAEKFSKFFDDAQIFKIPGRMFPVDVLYTSAPEADYLDAAVVTVLQIHAFEKDGDILVFLTGEEEVETAAEHLATRTRQLGSKVKELLVTKIYANLPTDQQAKIFEPTPPGARKVVLATNIAETSITINGVVFVIDPGFCKQNSYNPRTGMESLVVVPASKASCNQRAGRAGRVAPGKCYRLFTKWAYENELDENTIPEIQRTNLGNTVLTLKSLGINDLINFDFMDPPPAETLMKALEHLYALGALNDQGELTRLGRRMAEFPVDPALSKTILASEEFHCSEQIITIAAMLSVNNSIFYRPRDKAIHAENARQNFNHAQGDHMTLMNVYDQWKDSNYSIQWCFENFIQHRSMKRARDVRDQLEGLCERTEIELESNDDHIMIRKSITSGYFYCTAKLQRTGTYRTVKHGQTVHIHPSSSLFEKLPKWLVYFELVFTSKEFMRQIIEIEPEWLVEIAPHYYKATKVKAKGNKFITEVS